MQLQITALEPWTGLDLDLSLGRTQSCELLYLTASADVDLEQLQSQLEAATPLCYLHKVSSTAELSCLLIIYHQSAREEVLGVLRGFNTSRPDLNAGKPSCSHLSTVSNDVPVMAATSCRL